MSLKNKTKKAIKERKGREDRDLQAPKGMHDVLPSEQPWWERIGRGARDLADFYGFSRLDPPIMERAKL